jgi:hypothetical protein
VVNSKDSTFADTTSIKCLQYLNIYIKDMVLREARENVSYLDKQLEIVADPLLREKLQGLIANEMEKEMLVSKEAFRGGSTVESNRIQEQKNASFSFFFLFSLFNCAHCDYWPCIGFTKIKRRQRINSKNKAGYFQIKCIKNILHFKL